MYQTNPPLFPPTQPYQPTLNNQHNSSPTPPLPSSNIYNTKTNPTPPPTNLYNPTPPLLSTTATYSPSPQPTIRPMYPSPASAYRPQVQQPQLIPQMPNQNSQPPSTYPYPQYSNNSNTAAAANTTPLPPPTYPGQPPSFPQPMSYPMGGNTTNQQMNNINGSFLVSSIVDRFNFNTMFPF
jgi:hypothetical protein